MFVTCKCRRLCVLSPPFHVLPLKGRARHFHNLNTKSQLNRCYLDPFFSGMSFVTHPEFSGLYLLFSVNGGGKRTNCMPFFAFIFNFAKSNIIEKSSRAFRSDKATQSATLFDCDGFLNVY